MRKSKLSRTRNSKQLNNSKRSRKTRTKSKSNKQKCKKIRSKCYIHKKPRCCKTLRCLYPNEKGRGTCVPFAF